jgi:hypothetical protein
MRIKSENEFDNSQRKLSSLLKLIEKKERSSPDSAARELSLESMRMMAKKIQTELQEYERAHQHT